MSTTTLITLIIVYIIYYTVLLFLKQVHGAIVSNEWNNSDINE
ncbi:hypothetical protein swp_1987 [Shewanella piezotolerans WP3]|uniref:Uncharacterized protein n=1 Tax=Shewanella piezotolerans (strain WP3 / JCM 13877) TaxID=225849 RepID=B8CNB1_SHEPW|nr:hypothetical protein swp_1987 [Shewanella piezotolerans WP3]